MHMFLFFVDFRNIDILFHFFMHSAVDLFFKRFNLFIFRERGREGKREGDKH